MPTQAFPIAATLRTSRVAFPSIFSPSFPYYGTRASLVRTTVLRITADSRSRDSGWRSVSEKAPELIKHNICVSRTPHSAFRTGRGAARAAPVRAGAIEMGSDVTPSWEDLADLLPPVNSNGEGRLAHAKERLFGLANDEEPRVIFYRDNSSWCPYCERVWLALEEKQIPYRVEKINMRCYGPKPSWYTDMVPSGLLPAVKIDGQLLTESLDILLVLEQLFPAPKYTPLLPPADDVAGRQAASRLLQLERQVMGAWLQWLTGRGSSQAFEAAMDRTNKALLERGGPYFMGEKVSLVDAAFAPFLERIAASVPFYRGLIVRGDPRWPAVNAWFDAMGERPAYAAMKSDDFTHTTILEPQVGPCRRYPEGESYRRMIEGKDGSWDLPLGPETTGWGTDDGTGAGGAREEAARSLVENHEGIVRFALRSVNSGRGKFNSGSEGSESQLTEHVDRAFRYVAFALLKGTDVAGPAPEGLPPQVKEAAKYLMERVGVPRDLTYPAGRQLRAHLLHLVKQLGQTEVKDEEAAVGGVAKVGSFLSNMFPR
eukprot:TRINITY_DN12698_c0_g1_i1.p1 TRINITY_DN12698_c0_g1~~TRINITY_DN12698_c0_g1_i1.p1  ORF type:complete len:542 (-),score=62.11 TRINITY_DN12698_c0_g1_i1:485-2110(-)